MVRNMCRYVTLHGCLYSLNWMINDNTQPIKIFLFTSNERAQWLKLALSNRPNWVGASSPLFHLRAENDPVYEMCSVWNTKQCKKSRNPVYYTAIRILWN
jgi:hypothetical protein